MATVDDEIDALYQLPLGEFTPARNALAKRLGRTDPPIKELEKSSVPAWAINQLYWRHRGVYERLIDAAEALRTEHRKLLAGKDAKVRDAEKAHREAVAAATDQVRTILSESAQAATTATLVAVGETLQALPAPESSPGRLVRPLRPMGFEALAGVNVQPAPSRAPLRLIHGGTEVPAAGRGTRGGSDGPAPAAPRRGETPKPTALPAPTRLSAKESAKQAAKEAAEAKRAAAEARRRAEAATREAEREAAEEKARQRAAEAALQQAAQAVEKADAAFIQAEEELERRRQERDAAREALRRLKRAT